MLEFNQIDAAKELFHDSFKRGLGANRTSDKKQMISDYGCPGPMPKQDAAGYIRKNLRNWSETTIKMQAPIKME